MAVLDCACRWLHMQNSAFMYNVWLPSQLKRYPSEPDSGKRKIWILEDCISSETLSHSGKLMQLACFLFSFLICAKHINFQGLCPLGSDIEAPSPISQCKSMCLVCVCDYQGCSLHCCSLLVSIRMLPFSHFQCGWGWSYKDNGCK